MGSLCLPGMHWGPDMKASFKSDHIGGKDVCSSIYMVHNPRLARSTLNNKAVPDPQGSLAESSHSFPPHWG